MSYHLDIALNGKVHEVAASFFFGREKMIPEMFQSIVNVLDANYPDCSTFKYYLKRHIELDGDSHGPMALKCLNELIDSDAKRVEAEVIAKKSLAMRKELWDFIYKEISTMPEAEVL